MNISRFLLVSIACFCILLGTVGGTLHHIAHKKSPTASSSLVYIEPGSGLIRISWVLKNNSLIRAPWHFKLISTLNGKNGSLRAGEYEIGAGASIAEILSTITEGRLYKRRLVVPEGSSMAQIAEIIKGAPGLEVPEMMPDEGYVLPETYFYHYGSDPRDLLEQMGQQLDEKLDILWRQKPDNFPLKSKHEVLTLASIVEKETGLASERKSVAAVFLNRLKKGMRLQSDPTVIYGITQGLPLERRLLKSDLKKATDYNTYKIRGLPPGPIANPGIASIEAVIQAKPEKYLYFVADGNGGHAFSSTLREHNRNVRKWRKIRDSK